MDCNWASCVKRSSCTPVAKNALSSPRLADTNGNTATIAAKVRPALRRFVEGAAEERGETVSAWAREAIRKAALEELEDEVAS